MIRRWLTCLLFLVAFSACQPAAEETPTAPSSQEEDAPTDSAPSSDETTRATPTAVPVEGYPAPSIVPGNTLPEGYPAPPALEPTFDPYPVGEPIWIIRPVGEQCAEPSENSYVDLPDAVAALTAAGVQVDRFEMTELMVCQACGCPTSAHYRVLISSADMERAEALGWTKEFEG